MPRPATDMSGRLAETLRKTFAPVNVEEARQAAVEARMAALCASIDVLAGLDQSAGPAAQLQKK